MWNAEMLSYSKLIARQIRIIEDCRQRIADQVERLGGEERDAAYLKSQLGHIEDALDWARGQTVLTIERLKLERTQYDSVARHMLAE